jgi:hypothetical protein
VRQRRLKSQPTISRVQQSIFRRVSFADERTPEGLEARPADRQCLDHQLCFANYSGGILVLDNGSLNRAWEDKELPMVFVLAQCDGQSAIFEGTGDKHGEHITYRKTAEGLTFVGDFLHGGKPVRVEVKMRKAN